MKRPAGDGADEPDLVGFGEPRREAFTLSHVDAVQVDVHEPAQLTALVEDEVRNRQLPKSIAEGRALHLEAILTSRLGREQRRKQDHGH